MKRLIESVEHLEPTHYPPGSSAKIEILRQRAEQGGELHHPLDNRVATLQFRAVHIRHETDGVYELAIEAQQERRRANANSVSV